MRNAHSLDAVHLTYLPEHLLGHGVIQRENGH
jgi:hypothetical protein